MHPVVIETFHIPEPERTRDIYWDLFSVICFPVGIYRVISEIVGAIIGFIMLNYHRSEPGMITCHQIVNRASNVWLVYFGGLGFDPQNSNLAGFAATHNVNILTYNYRRSSSSFEDVVNDGVAVVRRLSLAGISDEKIVLDGLAFGGQVALGVGSQLQIATAVHNTSSSLNESIPGVLSAVYDALRTEHLTTDISLRERLITSIIFLLLSPCDLVYLVSFHVRQMIEYIVQCELEEALLKLVNVLSTLFVQTHQFILAALACITSPFTAVVFRIYHQIFYRHSAVIDFVIQQIVSFARWDVDNVSAWNNIEAPKILFHNPDNEYFQEGGSLFDEVDGEVYQLHGDHLSGYHTGRYLSFLDAVEG